MDLPNPWIEPWSPTMQADSLSAESPEKPKNNGVGSLSLLQGIFLTQESNWGLLHYRWILYQLSYKESLSVFMYMFFYPLLLTQVLWVICLSYKQKMIRLHFFPQIKNLLVMTRLLTFNVVIYINTILQFDFYCSICSFLSFLPLNYLNNFYSPFNVLYWLLPYPVFSF